MAKCIDLSEVGSILKVDLSKNKTSETGESTAKKPYKFDTHIISMDIFYDLFTGSKDKEGNTAFDRIRGLIDNSNVIQRLFGATRNVNKNNPLFSDLVSSDADAQTKHDNGQRMQIRGLVMHHILGAMKSDSDVQGNLGVDPLEAQKLLFNGNSRKVATIGMATALGREIAYTMGFKVSADPEVANKIYNKIGMNAINEVAENTELLTIGTDDYILNNKFQRDRYNKLPGKSQIIKGYTTVSVNYDKLVPAGDNFDERVDKINKALEEGKSLEILSRDIEYMENAGLVDGASRYIHRMSVPSNEAVPSYEPQRIDNGLNNPRGIVMSAEQKKLLEDLQNAPAEVNPRVGKFFLFLNQSVMDSKNNQLDNSVGHDFESIIKENFDDDPELLNFIFGTFDIKSSTDTKAKAVGQALSKTSTIQVLIEDASKFFNEDGSPKPLFYKHEMYRTGRVGFMESIMNPQTDKFFSRYILDGGEYTVDVGKDNADYIQLLNGIKDDSGLSMELITGEKSDTGLDVLLARYNEVFNSGLTGQEAFEAQKAFYTQLKDGEFKKDGKWHKFPKIKGSLWQKLHAIDGINDVHNAEGGTITTRFQTKPDATGSGIVLQLMQMLGLEASNAGSTKLLRQLGLMNDTMGEDQARDVYWFLEKAIEKNTGNETSRKEEYANNFVQSMIDLDISKDMREIAKPATMITSYLAGKDTVMSETGKAYADKIFDVLESNQATDEQIKFIMSIIEDYDSKNDTDLAGKIKNASTGKIKAKDIKAIPGVKGSLESQINKTVGEHMYNLIGSALTKGSMKNFQKKIIDMYGTMNKIAEEQERLIQAGEADPSTRIQMKVLPAQIVLDLEEFPDSNSWYHFKTVEDKDGVKSRVRGDRMSNWEILQKYGMMITSPSQTIVSGKDGSKTMVSMESSNALTSLVNVIHSMDSAIMFTAHRRTREKIQSILDGKGISIKRRAQLNKALNSAKFSIHDANNGNAVYNAIFQSEYRNTIGTTVRNYDMFEQMTNALLLTSDNASDNNTNKITSKEKRNDMLRSAKKSKKLKEQLVDSKEFNLDSDKTFGYSNELEYDENTNPEPEPGKKSKNSEKKIEEKKVEKKPLDSDEGFENPFGSTDKAGSETRFSEDEFVDTVNNSENEIIKDFTGDIEGNKSWSNYSPETDSIEISYEDDSGLTMEELVAHEIVHYQTYGYQTSKKGQEDNSVKYAYKTVKKLLKAYQDNPQAMNEHLSEQAQDRLNYVLTQKNEDSMVSELLSVLKAEPTTATELYTMMDKTQGKKPTNLFKNIVNNIISAARKWAKGITEQDLINMENDGINVDALKHAVDDTYQKGKEYKKNNKQSSGEALGSVSAPMSRERKAFMKKLNHRAYDPQDADKGKTPFVDDVGPMINNWTSSFIGNMITTTEHKFHGAESLKAANKYLGENFPIYANNRDTVLNYWDRSKFLQGMKGFLNPERFGDRITMERLITLQQLATQERGTMEDMLIADMKKMMSGLSTKQIEAIYDITSQAPMFHLAGPNKTLLHDLVTGKTSLNDMLDIESAKLNNKDKESAYRMANMLTGEEGHELSIYDGYNIEGGVGGSKEVREQIEIVVALKAMSNSKDADIGLKALRDNENLYNLILDATLGLKEKTDLIYNVKHMDGSLDAKRYRENLIVDQFEEDFDLEGITLAEFNAGLYTEDHGWQILREPKANEYGIVYRKSKDETYQQGAGTSISFKNTDVIIPKHKQQSSMKNVLSTTVGKKEKYHKMVLTRKEKEALGLQKNPADAIYRAYARVLEIADTQAARDLIISAEYNKVLHTEAQLAALDKQLETLDPAERKWMLKLPKNVKMSEITTMNNGKFKYPNIQKYYKTPERASSVGGFRNNFDLVRIDAEPWLTGYKDMVLFENHPGARKAAYAIRQAVKWTKITWTALSPTKIANDAISNTLILIGHDVPVAKIGRYGKDILREIGEFEKLRVQELRARVHGKDKLAAKLKKKIEDHPMAMMMNNGMMQSINVELFSRDKSVVTGLQKDIEEFLNKFVLLPQGEKSLIFNAIEWIQDNGDFGIESILEWTSRGAKNVKILENFGRQMEMSKDKFENMRIDEVDEMKAKYLSEFLMAPSSEAVQLGSSLVQQADIVARGILVRHMMDNGSTEEEAVLVATDAFINYKQNMPKELKMLSDYGVLLFPSFWMRAQRVIWGLLKKNPATAMVALSFEEMVQLNISSIFDANIVSKFDNGMFGMPPVLGFWQ